MSARIREILESAKPKRINRDQLKVWKEANVRKHEVYSNMEDLVDNIRAIGIQSPLLVKEVVPDKEYLVISGQRRLQAAKMAQYRKIPCLVLKEIELEDAIVLSLSENLYRQPMGDDDLSDACYTLMKKYHTLAEVGRLLGQPAWKVKKYLGYRHVEEDIKKLVRERKVTVQQAVNIHSKFNDPEKEIRIAKELARIQDRDARSKFSEAITEADSSDDVPELRKRQKEILNSSDYTIRLPSRTSQVYERIAAERNVQAVDVISEVLETWAIRYSEPNTEMSATPDE